MAGLKRFLILLILLLLSFFLQVVILPRIPGLTAVPNLMLISVICAGFLYGKGTGLGMGIFAGLLLDTLGTGIPGFYTLILSVLGYVNGMLSEKIESELILILFALFALNEAVFHAYVYLLAFLIRKHFTFTAYLNTVVLPELMLSLIAFLIIYGILIYLSKRWDLRVNKGEIRVV